MAKPEICKDCKHENVQESGFPCHLCGYLVGAEKSQIGAFKKKQTWGDKIRSMSDEELAEFLCGVFDEDECDGKYICGVTIPNYDEDKITEWLKSEVKE